MTTTKGDIRQKMLQILEERIAKSTAALQSLKEARDKETKSSAGDKFETGRAMVQQEQERLSKQLMQLLELQKDVFQLKPSQAHESVELGSLVKTNNGNYYLSVALGRIALDGENYFALSLNSPIGKLLKGKKATDEFQFQEKRFEILEVQ